MDTHPNTQNKQLNQQIRLEEIRLLYGGTPFSYSASVAIALIIYYVLLDHATSVQNLHIWLATILTVLLIRSIESHRFSKLNEQQQSENNWRIRFFIGTGIAGLCWGLLPWLGYSYEIKYMAFIIICLAGVNAGSLSTLSYRWETLSLFILPSILLLILRLATDEKNFSITTSLVLFVFILFSLSAGKRIFNNTRQNIQLRLEADIRERAIEVMHQKQALHLENTPLAIIEFDTDFNITEWNKSAENYFGYHRDEALNKNIIRLILPRDSSSDAEILWKHLLNHQAVAGTVIKNKTRSGSPIYCEWYITPLTDNKQDIVGTAAMALDITEKKQIEQAIIKSKEEAEKANQAKSDFLSNMSHELRTPLNAILGFTQLLKYEKTLTEKQQSHLSEINKAGNLLLELVNQTLDLARIEKGHLQLSLEEINLPSIIKECQSMIFPLAKNNHIHLDINANINGYVFADYTRLKQVLLNLLSNAIKYNVENGSISLNVTQKNDDIIKICITDTGKGISEELLKEVFQPFNRLNAACNIEGTGIGLSISKQLIEMMGGVINVTSKIDMGSDFCIELPGKVTSVSNVEHQERLTSSNTVLASSATTDYKILIAEDNPTNQALILNQLQALGYSADLAKNGQEALSKMLKNNYHLLLTDCNMPLVNGYELAETIRKQGNNTLPIIALTADAFPERKTECLNSGMNDLITKPVDLETLKVTLEKYLTIKS